MSRAHLIGALKSRGIQTIGCTPYLAAPSGDPGWAASGDPSNLVRPLEILEWLIAHEKACDADPSLTRVGNVYEKWGPNPRLPSLPSPSCHITSLPPCPSPFFSVPSFPIPCPPHSHTTAPHPTSFHPCYQSCSRRPISAPRNGRVSCGLRIPRTPAPALPTQFQPTPPHRDSDGA